MLEECLRARKRLWPNPPQLLPTIAEGIRLQHLGFTPFEILCELAEKDVIEVVSLHWGGGGLGFENLKFSNYDISALKCFETGMDC